MTAEPARELVVKGKPYEAWRLQPPPEENKAEVGRWVWAKYEALRRHRDKQGLVELWARNHELYRGRLFKRRNKWTQVVANLFFKIVNTLASNITDNKPRSNIMPNGETSDVIADGWQACFDEWWDETDQQGNLQASVKRSEEYGYQCDEMRFDPDKDGGLGEIDCHRHDTYCVFFWPGYTEIQDQPGMCTIEAMELGEIYDRWPEFEGKVKVDPEYSELLQESRTWTRATRSKMLRPEGSATGYVIPGGDDFGGFSGEGSGIQRALVVKFWVKDYSMEWHNPLTGEKCKKGEVFQAPVPDPQTGAPMLDDLTGQPKMQPVPAEEWSKYPGFLRCIVVTNKGKLVLEDAPNPSINPNLPRTTTCNCYLWDKFPFIKRYSYTDDMGEYGLSIIEQIETLVVEICKKLTQYGTHLDTVCRTPLILPQGCGIKRDQVNNLPERIWEPVNQMAAGIRFLEAPTVPQDIIAYIELLIRLVDMVTGITEVSQGQKPTGITAGEAIAALQEKAQVVFREKIRHNDIYLETKGRMFISLGQNWYTQQRQLVYEGKQGQENIDFTGTEAQGDMSFRVEAGSTLPRNREVRQAQIIQLAKSIPTFPKKVLFKELAVPNHDEVAMQCELGPLKMAMQKLKLTGLFDDATLQAIMQVLTMREVDFKKAFGTGNPYVDQGHKHTFGQPMPMDMGTGVPGGGAAPGAPPQPTSAIPGRQGGGPVAAGNPT